MRNFSISIWVDVEKWVWRRYHLRIYIFFLHAHTHTHTHLIGVKGKHINYLQLSSVDTASTTTNYMFWLLTPGHRQFLPRKSFLTLSIGDLFVFHFDFFCLELGPVIVPVSVPVPDLVSSVALESVATFRLLAKCFYSADRGSVIGDPSGAKSQQHLWEIIYVNYLCDWRQQRPTGTNEILETVWKFRFLVIARRITLYTLYINEERQFSSLLSLMLLRQEKENCNCFYFL